MTPQEFIARWKDNDLTERAGAQAHFDDLCDLLGVEKPRKPGEYQFEYGARKASGGDGWADVWKRDHFGWENKKPGRDLKAALKQLTDYALDLGNPKLLVVSDRERIEIHTAFNGYPDEPRTILLEDIGRPENLQVLRWVFTDPDKLRPLKSTAAITEEAAGQFAALAKVMRDRGLEAGRVAHFLIQCLFCMFAEDEGLLPGAVFTHLLKNAGGDSARAADRLKKLFAAMRKGGDYGDHAIAHFNGGLFKTIDVPPLEKSDLAALTAAASDMDWRAIEPAIFGTLFERGLNPDKRSQLGAHYTHPDTILRLIEPVITRPLAAEWEAAKPEIAAALERARKVKTKKARDEAYKQAAAPFQAYLERLRNFRVLDPACGSGNFLYLALKALKDLEKRANLEAEALGLHPQISIEVSPANVLGLEIEPFAAELARVTVWIGELQWMLKNGYPYPDKPILKPLDTIENRDALMSPDGGEADWPKADVIVGNPPFKGDKKMIGELGEDYTVKLRRRFDGRVPGGADFVTYWFEKSRAMIETGHCKAAGLVTTNSIRQKRNRVVLERILNTTRIFEVWDDQPWWDENGAAVRVSLVCFGESQETRWNDKPVVSIHADLTATSDTGGLDLTKAVSLVSNKGASFFGLCLAGPFKVNTRTALEWLKDTGNPNNQPNSRVIRPIYNGSDITRRWAGNWVVDFAGMEMEDATDYLKPFAYVEAEVKPIRQINREAIRVEKWWRHGRRRPELRAALHGLTYYIATPETAKHRFFVKFPVQVAPEHKLIVVPREDDLTLGVLSSRFHCVWAVAKGGRLGVGNDPVYNSSLCFETFPFPTGLDLRKKAVPDTEIFKAIAQAASELNVWRENWLNPVDWVNWEQTEEEKAASFPPRPIPKKEYEAEWKKRTLTKLYNEYPAGLRLRQEKIDKAVAAAYGWHDYTPEWTDEEILRRLLALNLERAKNQAAPVENVEESAPSEPTARQAGRAKKKAVS
jgi:type II restriction/modification system DNA methylase subunit YeeA